MAPKKGQKMSISAFLADATTGSWADEMEDLPTAPEPRASSRGGPGNFMDRPSLADRRDGGGTGGMDLPLPTRPPYTAHLGNLSYDLTDSDVRTFFDGCHVTSVRIPRDIDERPKGFGYVEFDTLDGLKTALERSGTSLTGRPVRVSVAEPSRGSRDRESGDRSDRDPIDDRADQASTWRRDKPIEPPPSARSERRNGFGGDRGGFGGERSGFGGERGGFGGDRGERGGFGGDRGDRGGFGGDRSFSGEFSNEPEVDRGERMGFGSKFVPSNDVAGSRSSSMRSREGPGRSYSGTLPPVRDEENSDWRGGERKFASPDPSMPPSEASTPSAPAMRKKLELKPRSAVEQAQANDAETTAAVSEETTSTSTSAKPSPFGSAKPIDNNAAIKRAEERAKARLEEERAAKEAAREAQAKQAAAAAAEAEAKASSAEPESKTEVSEVSEVRDGKAPSEGNNATKTYAPRDKPRVTSRDGGRDGTGSDSSAWTKRTLAPQTPPHQNATRKPSQPPYRPNGAGVHPSRRPSSQNSQPAESATNSRRPSQTKTADAKKSEIAAKQAMPRFEGLGLDEEA